jgi:hypothetical protein
VLFSLDFYRITYSPPPLGALNWYRSRTLHSGTNPPPKEMDPKGKGIVINDKKKETLYVDEPKSDKPTDLGSSHKKKDGKK